MGSEGLRGWEGRWEQLGAIGGVDGMGGKDVIGDVEEGRRYGGILDGKSRSIG